MDVNSGLNRLERAMAAFVGFRAGDGPVEPFLAAHEDLRDLLEPMVCGAPDLDPPTETVFGGDFRLEHELGRGGVGVVYAAWQLSLGRRVAVKVLANHVTLLPAAIARFRREAKTIATLNHDGIVRVLAVGSDEDTHWFAMDFIEGQTLEQHIVDLRRRGDDPAPSTRRMVGLAIQIAAALHHAHGFGIVHRDVKPSNVILRPDGSAVLTDFGLARAARDPSLTLSGGRFGTPCYMAPEQIEGDPEAVGARSDVFALGASLYEMLTFRRAFDAESTERIIARLLGEEPASPRRINKSVSADLAAVLATALEKDPARRYASAGEFADELRACLTNHPVKARRPTASVRLARWARRRPAQAALTVSLAVAIPALAAMLGYIVARAPLVRAGEARVLDELIEQGLYYAFHSERDHEKAEHVLDEAMNIAPEHPEVRIVAAVIRSRWSGDAAALAVLDERPDLLERHRELRRARAVYLWALGRRSEAEAIDVELGEPQSALEFLFAGFVEWRRAETGSGSLAVALRYLSLATRVSPRPRLGIVLTFADVAAAADDAAAREEAIVTLTTLWPESSRAWGKVAWILREVDPPRALAAVDRALELFPDEPGLLHYRGTILANLGDVDGAIRELSRVLALMPELTVVTVELERLRQMRR